jgi:hypothetical protein
LAEAHEREDWVELPDGQKHTRLFAIRATLALDEGLTVQWIVPQGATGFDVLLPAGEAAVFRLVREKAR